jgi:hypothetical protein
MTLLLVCVLAVGTALWPVPSIASDAPTKTHVAALISVAQGEKRMTPRRDMLSACAGENVRCGNPGDEVCCAGMFCDRPAGSTGICRHR